MNNSFVIPENIGLLKEDNKLLVSHYEKELGGVIRYMFNGYIVPVEIQDDVVFLRRNLHILQNNTVLYNKKKEQIDIQSIQNNNENYYIEYKK